MQEMLLAPVVGVLVEPPLAVDVEVGEVVGFGHLASGQFINLYRLTGL